MEENNQVHEINEEVIKNILQYVKSKSNCLVNNETVFEITEGNLEKYVLQAMEQELSPRAFNSAKKRIAPINILKKVLDKLSKLYVEPPNRTTENEADQELIGDYEVDGELNTILHDANFNFNAYKNTVIEFYVEDKKLKFRTLPSHQFLFYSNDPHNPLRATHFIKLMGTYVDELGNERQKFWIYSKDYFVAVNEKGKLINQDMENTEGINPYGVIPATYINRSKYLVTPLPDSDTVSMTTLFPRLMTDLNYSQMFTSHSVLYGIDIDAENLEYLPDTFWNLKSEQDGKPSVGVIKPEADVDKGLTLFKSQLGVWLESKNITVDAMDGLTSGNVVAGVALLIREMDTTQDKKVQEIYFKSAEENDFWIKLSTIHNYLASNGQIEDRRKFSSDTVEVDVEFSEMKPVEDRATVVNTAKLEVNAGFLSTKRAIKKLNPSMDDKEIEELMEEIEDEKPIFEPEDGLNGLDERKDTNRQEL